MTEMAVSRSAVTCKISGKEGNTMRQSLFSGGRWPAVSAAALVLATVLAGPVVAAGGGGKPMSLAAGDFKDPDQPGVVAIPGENQLAATLRRTPVFFRAPYAKGTVFISTKDKF